MNRYLILIELESHCCISSLFLSNLSGALLISLFFCDMNRSLDSVVDSMLSKMTCFFESSLHSSNLVSVANNFSSESGGKVFSAQYLLDSAVARSSSKNLDDSIHAKLCLAMVFGVQIPGETTSSPSVTAYQTTQ